MSRVVYVCATKILEVWCFSLFLSVIFTHLSLDVMLLPVLSFLCHLSLLCCPVPSSFIPHTPPHPFPFLYHHQGNEGNCWISMKNLVELLFVCVSLCLQRKFVSKLFCHGEEHFLICVWKIGRLNVNNTFFCQGMWLWWRGFRLCRMWMLSHLC